MSICNEQNIPLDKYNKTFDERYNFIYLDKINKKIEKNFMAIYNKDGNI